ncbi:MAG: hypothetical protein QOJ03_632 [Frankiaceae bacterium]|jgi:hypothetical protein|nr:hypothetical protein [Frankiaceae bacterium]
MGDKPGKYWDHNECRWVRYAGPRADAVTVPAQAEPVKASTGVPPSAPTPVASPVEGDVRSG